MLTQSTKLKMDNCTMNDLSENNGRTPVASSENHMSLPNNLMHDTSQFCRLCAHQTNEPIFIYGEPGIEQHLALKINAYLPITVKKFDLLPKQICMNCINKLQIISEFAENCLHAEEQLKKVLEPKILKSRRITSDISLIKKGETSIVDICQSFSEVSKASSNVEKPMLLMSDNSTLTCPLCCNGNMTAIQGQEKLVESNTISCNIQPMENESIEQQNNIVSSTLQNTVPLFDHDKVEIDNAQNANNELWHNKVLDVTKIDFNGGKSGNDLETHPTRIDTMSEENQHVSNKINQVVLCQICGKTFQCIDSCMDHCKHHFQTQDSCNFCNLNFDTEQKWFSHLKEHLLSTQLQVHDHYLCQDCNQLFETLTVFSMHSCPHKQYGKCDKADSNFVPENPMAIHQTSTQDNHSSNNLGQEQIIPEDCQAAIDLDNSKDTYSCQYCMQIFAKKSDYMTHIQTVHTDMPHYTCEVCDEKFLNQFVLQYHYASHTNLTSLQCVFCNLTFSGQPSLHQHLLSQHPKLLPPQACFKCNTCQETFTNLNDSVNHISTHLPNSYEQNHEIEEVHISQLYMCEYCESCFTMKSLLFQHYFIHSKDNRYSCKLCNTTFTSYGRLSKHKLLHNEQNKQNLNSTPENSTVIKLFVCQECEKCYTQWNSLNNHRRNCHQNNHTYTCKICNEVFNVYAEYQDHRKIHPAQVKTESDGNEKEYLCDYCQKTFHHHSTLALHQRVHLKGQPYACEICGETFRLKSTYDKHFRKHTGIKPYICDVCGKGFTQNSGLYTHRRVHTGEKPYACDLCGKNFRLKHDRDNHRRCHTGERPYQCSYCGKAFRTSHDHRQHLLIHTGQRPYRCDYCSKGFRRINGLNVHKRIHTGEKPYGCAICGRHFTQKGDMMKHCKTQHGNTF